MSWQKCDSAKPYSLNVPKALLAACCALHVWLSLSVLTLALPSEAVVLLWLLLRRSWRNVRFNARTAGALVLTMDARSRIFINEVSRSYQSLRGLTREAERPAHLLSCGTKGVATNLLYPGETGWQYIRHTREQHYTCCRSLKMPGCIYLDMLNDYGKRLEILVFYRYHQREFYLRLRRHLALK